MSATDLSNSALVTTNPILQCGGLPDFSRIRPEQAEPAISALLIEARALIERLSAPDTPATWSDFVVPLASGLDRLAWAWGVVGHLHSVQDETPWRSAYNALLPEVSRFYSALGQNQALFEKYKAIFARADFRTLKAEEQRVVTNAIRNFRLSGAELPDADKPRFMAIQEELSSLAAKFSENLLDATNAFTLSLTNEADLAGLPPEAIAAARDAASQAGKEGWQFGLQAPSYLPFMQYAENRALRERLYRAYATRASEFADSGSLPAWNNAPLLENMLRLRQEEAALLGYKNFAEVSLVDKMAASVEEVLAFLHDMSARAKPYAERDIETLRDFAAKELDIPDLQPWDIPFASEKLKAARYAFSEQEVRRYFSEPKVMAGLFRVVEQLFGIHIQADTAPAWDEAVRFYRLQAQSGECIGHFYVDLYARQNKRGGAWMDSAVSRSRTEQGLQTPVAYLVCNFSKPVGGKAATFTHDEAQTLFHEAGHALHHLLTRIDTAGVSGIDGVEWDAVELPSQFMENFCWEWEVVREMSAHVETGEPLPRDLFDRMLAARNFQSGMAMARQLEFALFDMRLHADFLPGKDDPFALWQAVRREVAVFPLPEWHRFPNSFAHIFGGGYAAGYYSYEWAEVLSADAYAAFEEAGNPLDVATGTRFLAEILAVGGSRPALDSFLAFRGRPPSPEALLRHKGMQGAMIE
ncbi:MAG: M3 family metallopeptidase [Zoogloeaceae bacterium]|jgi:oligopeptidase A|nr:M3 family metallopeptidase [Zoogloeaceae bacterium]